MAKAAKSNKVAKGRRPAMKPWAKILIFIVLFPFAALLLPTTLVFATMMAPTWVAYITDRSSEKHLAITVGLLNFSGTLPSIIELWSRGQSHNAAMMLISDIFVWAIAYGAAMAGWVLFGFMPSLIGSYFKMTTESRIRNLAQHQKNLIDEWGHAVAEGAGLNPLRDELDADESAGPEPEGDDPVEVSEAQVVQPAEAG